MRKIELSKLPSNDDFARLRKFSKSCDEFLNNFKDLKESGLNLSGSFALEKDGKLHGGRSIGVSRHRIKGFLSDYRLFHQQGEPIAFLSICKLLTKICEDSDFRSLIMQHKKRWQKPEVPLLGWHNEFSAVDVVETLFNEKIFHQGLASGTSRTLSEIERKFTGDALWYVVVFVVYDRLTTIRNTRWLIEPLLEGQKFVRLPN